MGLGTKGRVLSRIFEADLENGRAHYNKIRGGAVRSRVVGENNADDFVQDFYITVMVAAETYRYDITEDMIGCEIKGPLNTWLWTRFKGMLSSYKEKSKDKCYHLIDRENGEDGYRNESPSLRLADKGACVPDRVVSNERRNVVLAAIDVLPPLLKKITVWKYYMGENATEIGKRIGQSASNVRMKLCKIRDTLEKGDLACLAS